MRLLPILASVAAAAAALPAQDQSLLYFSRYDSTTIDATSGQLSSLRPFDIVAVTPGQGASAFPWVPSAASVVFGDPDADTTIAEFAGLAQASWGLGAPFVKFADKQTSDPRKVFWSILELVTSPPTVTLFTPSGTHVVRKGDWVRLLPNGDAEFFIRQEHFVKAIGAQSGNFVDGATCIAQASDGSIYYSPAHGISASGSVAGGHWVQDGQGGSEFAFDGAICTIPASAITYDARGNVMDVQADSARLVINEITSGPLGEGNIRDMCANSGALDSMGQQTRTTFWMNGIDIDPNGGTFTGWKGNTHPNLIFTFENTIDPCCGGLGSWLGTVFSTADFNGNPGSIATINGIQMGAMSVMNATGAWTGIVQGSGAPSAPILRGLAWIDGGFGSAAPYGNATLTIPNDGLVDLASDPNVRLTLQGPLPFFPSALFLGAGPPAGARPAALNLGGLLGGYATAHVLLGGPVSVPVGLTGDAKGQSNAVFAVPINNPSLVGQSLVWQTVSITMGQALMSNPVVSEIR